MELLCGPVSSWSSHLQELDLELGLELSDPRPLPQAPREVVPMGHHPARKPCRTREGRLR